MVRVFVGVCAVLLGTAVFAATEVEEDRFDVTVLASDLKQPLEVDVAPDGRVFFIELQGALKIWKPATRQVVQAAQFEPFTAQENGLLGLALDPNFAKTGWVYLLYSPKEFDGQRISRFTLKGDELDRASEKVLLTFPEQRKQCCHHAGALEFGPDGTLYASAGDNTNPFESKGYAPIDEREGRDPWDAQKSAANMNDLRGGIIRIKPEPDGTYSIPEGNLFKPGTAATRPEIFVKGCRNPWRFSVDAKTGYVYWGEVGPDAGGEDDQRGPRGYDEINQARTAGFFGWPYFVGNNKPYRDWDFIKDQAGDLYDAARAVNRSPNNTGIADLPPAQPAFIWYPGGKSEEFPVLGSGGRTACAGPVYHHDPKAHGVSGFPAAYDNTLFIYEWSRHWIMAVHLTSDSKIDRIEPFMPKTSFKRPVDMVFGAAGEMYLLEYGETWGVNADARLVRIDYMRGNRAPVARAKVGQDAGPAPLKAVFSAEDSTDKDGIEGLTYAWRTKPGGPIVAKGVTATIDFPIPGVHTVELTVTDPAGAVGTAQIPVMVGNARPLVHFSEPRDGDFFEPDQPIQLSVTVEDDQPFVGRSASITTSYTGGEGGERLEPEGLSLMRKSDCFNCHAMEHKIVGPPLVEIAKRYNKDPKSAEQAAQRVVQGSSGVWGTVPMLPHPQHKLGDTQQMVAWIFTLTDQKKDALEAPIGSQATLNVPKAPEGSRVPNLVLSAAYSDPGAPLVGPLTGMTEIRLRPARLEAEDFDGHEKLSVLGTGDGGHGQQMLGAIESESFVRYGNVSLRGIRKVICRVASAGRGGTIEFRADKAEGELLGSVAMTPTGGWDKFVEVTAELKDPGRRVDLHVVFRHPEGGGGLMNVNWFHFRKE